jgi:hypothetical protein
MASFQVRPGFPFFSHPVTPMKFSGVTFSIHPVKGRIERTVVLDEVTYLGRRFWKSRADWFDHEHGRSFNPRARWMLDPATVTPLSPDSPLLHPVRKPQPTKKKAVIPAAVLPAVKPVGGRARSRV